MLAESLDVQKQAAADYLIAQTELLKALTKEQGV
jgi:hypothetical protein